MPTPQGLSALEPIAERAGLTERGFFWRVVHKREALLRAAASLADLVVSDVTNAPSNLPKGAIAVFRIASNAAS
jgi:hypothetical protein